MKFYWTFVLCLTLLALDFACCFLPVHSPRGPVGLIPLSSSSSGGSGPSPGAAQRPPPGLYNYHRLQLRREGLGHLWQQGEVGSPQEEQEDNQNQPAKYPDLSSESKLEHAPYDRLPHRYEGLPASWCATLGGDGQGKNCDDTNSTSDAQNQGDGGENGETTPSGELPKQDNQQDGEDEAPALDPNPAPPALPTALPLRQVQLSLVEEGSGSTDFRPPEPLPSSIDLAGAAEDEEEEELLPAVQFETVDLTPAFQRDSEDDDDAKEKKRKRENAFRPSSQAAFKPSKAGPPIEGFNFAVGSPSSTSFGAARPTGAGGHFRHASHPVYSTFGVSVDFAGHHSDNPLYRPQDNVPPQQSFEREVFPTPNVSPYETSFSDAPGYFPLNAANQGSNEILYSGVFPTHFRQPRNPRPPIGPANSGNEINNNPFTASFKDSGSVGSATNSFVTVGNEQSTTSSTTTTTTTTHLPPPVVTSASSTYFVVSTSTTESPVFFTQHHPDVSAPDDHDVLYLTNELTPPSSFRPRPPPPPPSPPHSDYGSASLLRLTPGGPSVPILKHISSDLDNALRGVLGLRGKHASIYRDRFRKYAKRFKSPPPPPPKEDGVTSRVGHMLNKLMGAHYGDRSFDVYDWLPLAAILLSSALLFAGLFPNGFSSFGINNGNVVLGRESRRDDDGVDGDLSRMDLALEQLESGILLLSALREEDGCAERLACRLGDLAKDSFHDTELVLGAINLVMPHRYSNFSRSLEKVMVEQDRAGCSRRCQRCISIQ